MSLEEKTNYFNKKIEIKTKIDEHGGRGEEVKKDVYNFSKPSRSISIKFKEEKNVQSLFELNIK